jgi:hypothetical protein
VNKIHRSALLENVSKHLIILVLGAALYSPLLSVVSHVNSAKVGDFLFIISILLVTVCFGNYAQPYDAATLQRFSLRLLTQALSFIFLLLIALLLEVLVICVKKIYPPLFVLISAFSILLYLGLILFDFWDFVRTLLPKP